MPETPITTTFREELASLVKGEPTPAPVDPPATDPPAAPIEVTATEVPPVEPVTPPVETPADDGRQHWDKSLQKWQQKQATEMRSIRQESSEQISRLEKQLAKLMEASGVEPDPTPPEPAAAPKPADDPRIEEALWQNRALRIKMDHPKANPEAMRDEALQEAFDTLGVTDETQALPPGVTVDAVKIAVSRIFERKVAALAKAKNAPPPPTNPKLPPPKVPPMTPGGASVAHTPVSHVPAPRARNPLPTMLEDIQKALAQART